MDFNFGEIHKLPLLSMKINRSHPSIKRDLKWFLYFISTFSIFTYVVLVVIYNIIYVNLKNKEFNQTCKNGAYIIVFIVNSFQYFNMLWKQNIILNLISLMKKDYELAKTLDFCEQEIMHNYIKKSIFASKQWSAAIFCTIGCFVGKSIVLMILSYVMGDPKLIPINDLVYPAIVEENKNNICVHIIIDATMVYFYMYSSCMYIAFVPMGPIFVLHTCSQLEILEKRIEVLFKGDLEDAEEKLKEIIKQLQYIYDFVEQILASLRVYYEFILKGSTFLLPISFFEVIEAIHNEEFPLEFISVMGASILISSIPCYYSDLLMEKGEKVRIATYSCGWESVSNTRIRSMIALMLTRALKPVAIQTPFRTVCLEALTDLFQQSYAIFNLMNVMWK